MVSLGRVAELAGVRKPKGASGSINNAISDGVDGTGIASGQASASIPYILEPAPISAASASGSTSSSTSTVELSSAHLQHHQHFPHHPSYYSTHPPSSVGGAVHAIISGGAAAERSASAIDLYERAIRDATEEEEEVVEAATRHKQHGSDPMRPAPRSTSTPPENAHGKEISEAEEYKQTQQQQEDDNKHQQEQYSQSYTQYRTSSPHLHPPSGGVGAGVPVDHSSSSSSSIMPYYLHEPPRRQGSGHSSNTSPASDPSPGSHASTSIVPEHHRLYPASYLPAGSGAGGNIAAGHFSNSSSPTYIQHHQHHQQQQHPQYAYHTQYYAPQYHYPPPQENQQTFYTTNIPSTTAASTTTHHHHQQTSSRTPVQDSLHQHHQQQHYQQNANAAMSPQTFFPQGQTYFYPSTQIIHMAGPSSPDPNAHGTTGMETKGNTNSQFQRGQAQSQQQAYASGPGGEIASNDRSYSAQSIHQQQQQQQQHQQHQQHQPYAATTHQQHSQHMLPPHGMTYQFTHQSGVPTFVTYTSPSPAGQQHSYVSYDYPQGMTAAGAPVSPVLGTSAYGYNQNGHTQGSHHRYSIDHNGAAGPIYRPVSYAMTPPPFASPSMSGSGGGGGGGHMRLSTTGSDLSGGTTPYSSVNHSVVHSPYMQQQHGRISSTGQTQLPPTELARGHLAQSKFREALGAFDPNSNLPVSQNERRRQVSGDARLPKPPSHSPWAMWVGNIPSDATHPELWRFFASRPPPGIPEPGSTEETEADEAEALHADPEQTTRPDHNTVGIESIHLISRSNCCFVNMASKRHLDHAIKVCNGLSLRPHDPRCKTLVCRIRKKDDDNKTGVGAQRGKGMHQAWVAEQQEKNQAAIEAANATAGSTVNTLDPGESPAVDSEAAGEPRSSASNVHSASTSSTTSSFLHRYFPKRFFILKSHSEDDLHLSVERGLWATQSHNEPVLDQAYRTANGVFLIFSANKSGEFFGYAKMAGGILKPEKRNSWSGRSPGSDVSEVTPGGGKSSTSVSRRPEPSIPETPEDETAEEPQRPASLAVPSAPIVLSPSGVVSNSPQPMSNAATPAHSLSADAQMDYLSVRKTQHNTAPSPSINERERFETRKADSLDPSILASLAKMEIKEQGIDIPPEANIMSETSVKAVAEQLANGSSGRPGREDSTGVTRKDTILSPEERNAKLEQMEQEAEKKSAGAGSNTDKSLKDAMDQGISKPFKVEWIRVQKVSFYRTRHLRNAFNGNREVKISRDGTEIEPEVGQQLLDLFWKDPASSVSQNTSPVSNAVPVMSPQLQ